MKELTNSDIEKFNELWAGALFEIITSVMAAFPEWGKDDQNAMTYMVIRMLAERYGIVDELEGAAAG